MKSSRFSKSLKKISKKVGRTVKKRYFAGRGYSRPNISRMAKDLAIVKSMVNAEKEIYTALTLTNQNVELNTPYFNPITNIAEGTSAGQRDGESVKLHGFRWNTRVKQQSAVINPIFCKMWLVKYIGPRGSTPAISTFLKPDFDGAYSTMSERNEDYYSSYVVISSSGLIKITADTISGQTNFSLRKKYGKFRKDAHQRYSGALATDLITNQMYVIIVSSGGNNATNTAVQVDTQLLISFYDN